MGDMMMNKEQVDVNRIADQQERLQTAPLAEVQEGSRSDLTSGWFSFSNPAYLKGFLLAAGITFAASNPKVRKAVSDGAIKVWTSVQGGVEEFKEKVQDVRAEMSQKPSE